MPARIERVVEADLLAVQHDRAARRREVASDDLDQCGLARTVVAHEAQDLSLREGQVHARQRLDGAEVLRDGAQVEDVIGHG